MATSTPNPIPLVCTIVHYLEPKSILEIGPGFGKYGHILREYADLNKNVSASDACQKTAFRIRIDALEACQDYISDLHRFLYDRIIVGDAAEVLSSWSGRQYDLVFIGDVIEHFEKETGKRLVTKLLEVARWVLVITPRDFFEQVDLHGNEWERHRSHWRAEDFGAALVDYQGTGPSMTYLLSATDRIDIPGFGHAWLKRLKRAARFVRDDL